MSTTKLINNTSSKLSPFNRKSISSQRKIQQITDTALFEIRRNVRKFIFLAIVIIIFHTISTLLFNIQEQNGMYGENPTILSYVMTFMFPINILIVIIAISFGGSMLVVDFQGNTGNLLFPKISRDRILVGRFIAGMIMSFGLIILFYAVIGFVTLIKFSEIPNSLWTSLAWALLYMNMNLSFVVLFSSFLKKNSSVVILSMLFLLVFFDFVLLLLPFLTTIEPLFIPTYYGKIITGCFNAGDLRSVTVTIGTTSEMTSWSSPSSVGAVLGMLLFTIIFTTVANFLYKKRQDS
ncbi:ABC transporter permease [Candidatus Lokiarchaeum ossiferum]